MGGSVSSGGASRAGRVAGPRAMGSGGAGGIGPSGGNGGHAGASAGSTGGGGRAGSAGNGGGSAGNGGRAGGTGTGGGNGGGTGGAANACTGVSSGAYYLDSASGNDSNDGLSPASAWKTLAKVNGVTFQPGNKLCLKAGASWTGQLAPKGSGTSAAPIVVDQYGSGPKPLLAAVIRRRRLSHASINSTGSSTTWR